MLSELDRGDSCNRLLHEMSDSDFGLISPKLALVDLPARKRLEIPNKPIDAIYFFDNGLASVVATGPHAASVCVGLIGAEGAAGLPAILGVDRSTNETCMQFEGRAHRIATEDLLSATKQSETLRTTLLTFCHAFGNQVAQTALANSVNTIEQRLARWLCMAHDRSDTNRLSVTHDKLAEMLGVRRPAITVALSRLSDDGSISTGRGAINIGNRIALEAKTDGMYGRAEREFERLFSSGLLAARPRSILDIAYYNDVRSKSAQRVADGGGRCERQRILIAKLEERGQPIASAQALLNTMLVSLDLSRKHLARTERAIELERARES